MTSHLDSLKQKRATVLIGLQSIDHLRRGSLSKQFLKGSTSNSSRGPYFVLQGFLRGKKFSERIPSEQAPQVQQQVDNYRRFNSLAEEYISLSDQITRLESEASDSKKNSRLRRSSTDSSRKPKPS